MIAGLDYWRTLPIKQQPAWPDAEAVAAASAEIATLPPLVFAGEVDILRDRLARAASRRGVPAAGRRLRRDLRRRDGRADPQPRQDGAADGGRAHLRRLDADREDGPHGGPVRQAPLERHRDPRRRHAARLPRRHRQRLRLHRRSRARPTRARLRARATTRPRRRSTSSARSRRVASPTCARCTAGTRASPRTRPTSATSASPREIDRAIKFMEAAGADFDELQARRVLHRATRACSWTTSGR